jgi:predicted amino acid-binding ACT domain protein
MNPLNTLNHLIEEFEADLEDISREIIETTNYETIHISQDILRDSVILQLNYEWDEKKQHLDNLRQIKKTLEELSQDDSTASQDAL